MQCRCRESQLIGERNEANAAVTAQLSTVAELKQLVDQQTHQLNSLKAEVQVSCCITALLCCAQSF